MTNNSDWPYGIQTDIVGTDGSSGSPVVTLRGEAIGIAQQVFTSDIDLM
jgi:S1-C subfamily serine protease